MVLIAYGHSNQATLDTVIYLQTTSMKIRAVEDRLKYGDTRPFMEIINNCNYKFSLGKTAKRFSIL